MMRYCAMLVVVQLFSLPSQAQSVSEADRRALLSGDIQGTIERLSLHVREPENAASALDRARNLELLGEAHHRRSAIGEAKRYWDLALAVRRTRFGDSSAEAGVGHAYQARYHNYMGAPQLDHQEVAVDEAQRAVRLIGTAPMNITPNERILALREQAYALKVMRGHSKGSTTEPTRQRFRNALHRALVAKDTIWTAQLLHDLGNTFTDMAIRYRSANDTTALLSNRDSALWYYHRSTHLMQRIGLGISGPVMMDHFTTALLYDYTTPGSDSSLAAFDRALHVLHRMHGALPGHGIHDHLPLVDDPAQVVELLFLRSLTNLHRYEASERAADLDRAIQDLEAAVPYWEDMLRTYPRTGINKVAGSYSHFPFLMGAGYYATRYLHNPSASDLMNTIVWSERNRNITEQQRRLQHGSSAVAFLQDHPTVAHVKAPSGTLIVAYHTERTDSYAIVIDADGPELIALGKLPADMERSFGRYNELPVNERTRDPDAYVRDAHHWYTWLLAPVLKGRREKQLVIVPHGSMAHLSFDALLADGASTTWNSMAFFGHTHRIRYARSIHEALAAERTMELEGSRIGLVQRRDRSDLPFARALHTELVQRLPNARSMPSVASIDMGDLLTRPGLVHLASHAAAPSAPDASPYVLLADGPWPLEAMDTLSIACDLVVLSACSGGSGRVYSGDGANSLANAFLNVGAGAVVHALWPVDDRATNEILGYFYDGLLAGGSACGALQRAKVRFVAQHPTDGLADPFYWSGIVLTGRDVRIRSVERTNAWYWLGVPAIAAACGGWFYMRRKRARARSAM